MSGAVGVIGASGFIGNRVVEVLHLRGESVVPISRRAAGLALASRFDLTGRVADARDEHAMSRALQGCDRAVVAIAGDPRTIVDTVAPIYRAADAAGVRRLAYLSTASVHGQSPAPGTDETTPLSTRQRLPYNNAKVRAERELLKVRGGGATEVVLIRPGIVHGPRSQWTGGLADDLLAGRASLVDGGRGICNAVYVDNVVHALRLALAAPGVDGKAFLVGDREHVLWADLYRPIARAFGLDVRDIPVVTASDARRPGSVRRRLRASAAWRRLPAPVRAGLRAADQARRPSASDPTSGDEIPVPAPTATVEQVLLQTCSYALPWTRARDELGYEPVVPFDEATRRSVAWLAFAGYPVVDQGPV